VQAGTGRFVIDESPDVARDALETIEEVSRDALQEMRRLLSVLRDDDGSDDSELVPSPTLDGLPDLVAATCAAGIDVDVRIEGERVALPSGVDLCAFRIVQEALTNVRRHSRAARATVAVHYAPAEVVLEITDDGNGPPPGTPSGHGLVGMRERATLCGGTFEAGPAPGVGFRVAARIPVAEAT
jgi:signal transduction histidine kinase